PSDPTTASPSPAPMPCSISPNSRCGGSVSVSQLNGRHERMHLTLKKQTTRPAGMNSLQQQATFDAFVHEFNNERPHEALNMKYPAEIYTPSPRLYQGHRLRFMCRG